MTKDKANEIFENHYGCSMEEYAERSVITDK